MNSRKPTILLIFRLLSRKDRKKISLICLVQIALGFLDLLGVAAIGMVGALSVRGVQSRPAGDRVSSFLGIIGIEANSFQSQAMVLALIATFALVTRTLLSMYITKKTLRFLTSRGAELSTKIISGLLRNTPDTLSKQSSQEIVFNTTTGVDILMIRVLGSASQLVTDIALSLILFIGIMVVDFKLAFLTLFLFGLIFFALVKGLHQKSERLSVKNTSLQIRSNELLWQAIESYRELNVGMRQGYIQEIYRMNRINYAGTSAGLAFLPNVSKYVFEMALVVGGVLIAAAQFFYTDASRAVGSLVLFIAAGTRIAPALLRIQQSAMQMRGSGAQAQQTLEILNDFSNLDFFKPSRNLPTRYHEGFLPKIQLNDVTFSYTLGGAEVLKKVSLEIQPGTLNAIVGPSGAGKSTLVDVLLGILRPTSGEVFISGMSPSQCIENYPGAIGYVPQEIHLIQGTLRENLSLGYNLGDFDSDEIAAAAQKAQLTSFISNFPEGLDLEIGDKGVRPSGGQKQRIGITRALLTNPKILILDEATSSLDGQTEASIAEELLELRNGMTVLVIAHRLSTIKEADQIFYLDNGAIKAAGTFAEVRAAVPAFELQAKLLGL
jgi:ABC-type multidrug transport system fused ATPase/permease subunit